MLKNNDLKSPVKNESTRQPGESSGQQINTLGNIKLIWILFPCFFLVMAILEWIQFLMATPSSPLVPTVLTLLAVIFSWWKISQINEEVKRRELGLEGEREVADELENLMRKDCYVYHDLQGESTNGNKFNVDHVVVSTYGIYVIETKAYSKPRSGRPQIDFDGSRVTLAGKLPDAKPIQQADNNATWLQNQIRENTSGKTFPVKAIVVFPGWLVPADQIKNGDRVWVMNPNYLKPTITNARMTIIPTDVELVNTALRPLTRVHRGAT
jgi:hypothetical protein